MDLEKLLLVRARRLAEEQRVEARAFLEGKVRADATAARRHALAPLLHEAGDADGALRHLKMAVLSDPTNADARHDFALAIFRRDRVHWQRAVDEFKRCLEVKPDHALTHKSLAAVYSASGRYADALRHALISTRLAPRDAQAWRNLARIYDVMGNSRDALTANDAAIEASTTQNRRLTDAVDRDDHAQIAGAAQAYRRAAVLRAGRSDVKLGQKHFDAYRAIQNKPFELPDSQRTVELLLRAKQDLL
ncbi:hypothetical protein M885DRAFT_514665 [Pelagophyceae sp. CCMP2097]|nr:hypothetical protein M885DRAFT_514665 [Pelagophyceae sp. CCMP2097]